MSPGDLCADCGKVLAPHEGMYYVHSGKLRCTECGFTAQRIAMDAALSEMKRTGAPVVYGSA